jgi:hypothetical protein
MKRHAMIVFVFLCLTLLFIWSAQTVDNPEAFRVNLSRVDNVKSGVLHGFIFEKDKVAETVQKYPIKLPKLVSEDAQLGYFYGGPIFAIKQKVPGESKIKLILDTNANFDLTDDDVLVLPNVEKSEEASLVKIARHFAGPPARTERLPYFIWYRESKGRNGQVREDVCIKHNYKFTGEFRLGNKDYIFDLVDGDARGRFIREKLVNVFIFLKAKDEKKSLGGHRFFELIQIENSFYEVKDFAEDGSWIDFIKSPLPTAALGKAAPDMELKDTAGQNFRLSDYRGKLLLLDFWPSWCKPCVAEFAEIKKIVKRPAFCCHRHQHR